MDCHVTRYDVAIHIILYFFGQLENAVAPELQQAARELLCNYWGSDFVEEIEKKLTLTNYDLY